MGMKPVLISTKKTIGKTWFFVCFTIISAILSYLAFYFSISKYFPKDISLPVYSEYAAAVLSGWIVAYLVYKTIKAIQIRKQRLLVFSVNLAVDNSYHYLQAPSAMKSVDFLKLFFKYLVTTDKKNKYNKVLSNYIPELEIRRVDKTVRVDWKTSLLDAGLKNGDICQIIGKPKSTI